MKATTKEFIKITVILVALFLVLQHARGAVSLIGAGSKGWVGVIKAFQGKG